MGKPPLLKDPPNIPVSQINPASNANTSECTLGLMCCCYIIGVSGNIQLVQIYTLYTPRSLSERCLMINGVKSSWNVMLPSEVSQQL